MATPLSVNTAAHRYSVNWSSAAVAGIGATLVMTALLYMANAVGMVHMDMVKTLGTMFVAPGATAYVVGGIMHLMMGIIFAAIYALAYQATGLASNWKTGLGFGFIHWIVAGIGLGLLPLVHPPMPMTPGFFLVHQGMMGILGLLMLHLVYGAVVGAMYRPKETA